TVWPSGTSPASDHALPTSWPLGQTVTKVSERNGRLVLNGRKFYSTGSLFADWIDVFAQRAHDGSDVIVAVATAQPGVI
ncbi:hypothetical protein QM312_36940, partial [Burkholderia cenocepacia]|nr:hypothetical protein [Burkholderia cenocepacia]